LKLLLLLRAEPAGFVICQVTTTRTDNAALLAHVVQTRPVRNTSTWLIATFSVANG